MNTSILRLATSRRQGYRAWKNINAGIDMGMVSFGYHDFKPAPPVPHMSFMWKFHDHPGGTGGLMVDQHRDTVIDIARKLITRNS